MLKKMRLWQMAVRQGGYGLFNLKYGLACLMVLGLLCINIPPADALDCNLMAEVGGEYSGDLAGVLTAPSSQDLYGVWDMAVGSELYINVEVYDTPVLGDLIITGSGTLDPDTGLASMVFDFMGTRSGTGGVDCDGNFFFVCPEVGFNINGVLESNGDASGTWDLSFQYFLMKIAAGGTFTGHKLNMDPNLVDWNGNLVADFGANGLWYHDGASWHWMSNDGDVGRMMIWDGKLVVDFGADKGLWYYDTGWHWMTNNSGPHMMINWDNGTTEVLVVDYGAGQRIYTYDGAWNWFSNKDEVADMTVWNNKLIVDFGAGRGIYNNDGAWHWMTNKDEVNLMLPWDDGATEVLVVDFGGGRRMYTYDGSWNWFTNKDTVNDMTVWNQKLVVDFGGGGCLYTYDGSWSWLSNKDDVSRMVTWRDAGTELAVDFGSARNMYNYDGSWNWIKNANDVPEMLAWNNRLVVDFGSGLGVYNYNGSWHQMKPWSTAD